MTLTKYDITTSIRNQLGLPKARSVEVVGSLLEIMKKTLESGEDVLISRFGKFCVEDMRELRGRNPASEKDMMFGSRRVVTFKCSQVLREKINGRR